MRASTAVITLHTLSCRCQQTPLTSFKAFQEAKNSLKNKYGQKDSADSSTHSLVWVRSEKNVWNCNYCNKSFSSKSDMEKHAASHSENTILLKHSVQFKDTDKLPVDSVIRDLGSREVEWSNKIRISVITSEGSGCEKRSEMREKKADLVRKDFSCKICERTFTRKYDLKRHLKCHSQMLVEVEEPNLMIGNDTSGKCGDMDWENETLNYETFEEEEDDEKDEKSNRLNTFHCAECGKHFKLKDSYYRHLRIHTGERPFTCHICGKQFRDSGGLARHLKDVHARIKNFSCDLCGRSFASKATTEDHRRIHTGERPYICDSCGKTFKSKASLYIHAKIHSDSFPYDCSSCEKRFRRRQELLAHVTTHTGEKPHACEVCGRCFRVRGELLRHKLVHSEEKPHVCTECGLTFRQKRYLKNHQKTRHPKSDVNV